MMESFDLTGLEKVLETTFDSEKISLDAIVGALGTLIPNGEGKEAILKSIQSTFSFLDADQDGTIDSFDIDHVIMILSSCIVHCFCSWCKMECAKEPN